MSNWLSDRLTPPKIKEARWLELSTVLERVWEEFFDPAIARLECLRSTYTSNEEDLIKKIREMGDYFSYDMPRVENRPISLSWRRLELEYKDMKLIISSVFRRHYNNLPVHWLPLYASLEFPYGTHFEIAPEFKISTKNIPPKGMFLTSRGMLGVDYGYLMTMGFSKSTFLARALPLIRRAKPLHIVFDGMLWFIRFDFPFETLACPEKSWWERDWGVVELAFSLYGNRFDYTPADAVWLDCQPFYCDWEKHNLFPLIFWPENTRWRLDRFFPESFQVGWLPVDCLVCGAEGNKNQLGFISNRNLRLALTFMAPVIKGTACILDSGSFFSDQSLLEGIMSGDIPTIWQQARLLNRYYEKVGMAAAGRGCCPQFTEFAAGYGLVDDSVPANPVLLQIPADLDEIPGEFYRGPVEAEYANGVTLCKCEIPQTAVGSPVRHNLIGIFDQDGDLVAVCQTLPDWVTPSEIYRAFPAITFPIEKDDENV